MNFWSSAHTALISLQFFQNLISTDALGQQLFHKVFRFVLLCFFGGFLIGGSFLGFQLGQLFLGGLKSCLLLFQISFQSVDVGRMEVISAVREAIDSCFSAIWDAKSVVSLGRFLLPFVLGIFNQPFYYLLWS